MARILTVLVSLLLFAGTLHGQQESAITFDFDHRSRLVYWDEGLIPADGWVGLFSRHRSIVGVTWLPLPELQIRAAMANEFFRWYRHRNAPDFTFDEIFFENLYLRWQPESLPFSLTVGRQNMMFDEGFVIMDGGPLDGSRSIYFNAARCDVQFTPGHAVTGFVLHQPVRDEVLPRIADAERALLEVPTDAAGLYYAGAAGEGGRLSAYYLYTHEDYQNDARTDLLTGIARHTVGGRYSRGIGNGWRLTGEGNVQLGSYHVLYGAGTLHQRAWSWYAYATWQPSSQRAITADAGMYQYSGGRYSGGGGAEGDQRYYPVLARWPKWSESFIYTLLSLRGGVATWSNLLAPFLRVQYRFSEPVAVRGMLQYVRESHATGGAGKDIGTLAILEAKVDAGRGITGHALLEHMWLRPDGVTVTADRYVWARLELRCRLRI